MIWIALVAGLAFMASAALRAKSRHSRLGWLAGLLALLAVVVSLRAGPSALTAGLPLVLWLGRVLLQPTESGDGGASVGPIPSGMTRQEALRVLGLEEGASRDEIVAAHRSLIKKLHPDQGGSGFLAQQVNEAKKFLDSG